MVDRWRGVERGSRIMHASLIPRAMNRPPAKPSISARNTDFVSRICCVLARESVCVEARAASYGVDDGVKLHVRDSVDACMRSPGSNVPGNQRGGDGTENARDVALDPASKKRHHRSRQRPPHCLKINRSQIQQSTIDGNLERLI